MGKRKPNGFWKNMSDEDLIHYVRSWHYGDRIVDLQKSKDASVYHECLRRGLISKLAEEETLIRTKNESGTWREINKGIFEAKRFLREHPELEDFPGADLLERYGFGRLANAITRYYGGFPKFRRALLEFTKTGNQGNIESRSRLGIKDSGYWKTWENVERELKEIIRKVGHFPSSKELKANGLSSINHPIHKYYGGFGAVRKRMGYITLRKTDGYWQIWENVERELKVIIGALGHFPNADELKAKKLSTLAWIIGRDYDGMNKVREKMGYPITTKTKGYWMNLENIYREAENFLQTHQEYALLPSAEVLTKCGYSYLISAIHKYGGGILKFRAALAERMGRKTQEDSLEEFARRYVGDE